MQNCSFNMCERKCQKVIFYGRFKYILMSNARKCKVPLSFLVWKAHAYVRRAGTFVSHRSHGWTLPRRDVNPP